MTAYASSVLVASLLTGALGFASEWSQFRGPNAAGVSESTRLPVEFGPDTNVVWKTALPPGHSFSVDRRDADFRDGG